MNPVSKRGRGRRRAIQKAPAAMGMAATMTRARLGSQPRVTSRKFNTLLGFVMPLTASPAPKSVPDSTPAVTLMRVMASGLKQMAKDGGREESERHENAGGDD